MNRFTCVVLSMVALLASSILGCGGDEFTPFPPGDVDSGAQDSKLPDVQQETKPDVKHDVEAGKPDVKPEAEASVDAKPEAETGPKDTGLDKEASPEAEPEVQPEASPEAEVEAEASSPEVEPEASPEAGPDVEIDSGPDAEPDVELQDVAQEDAVVLTDCQKYGKPGWATVVVTVSDDPPVGKVLGIFGEYSFSVSDAGTPQGYAVWKLANPGEKVLMVTPVAATVGLDITFEPGFTAPGNNTFVGWTYRCSNTGCPDTDEYIVCVGETFVGSYSGGTMHGNCETKLNATMTFQQLHCWQ